MFDFFNPLPEVIGNSLDKKEGIISDAYCEQLQHKAEAVVLYLP